MGVPDISFDAAEPVPDFFQESRAKLPQPGFNAHPRPFEFFFFDFDFFFQRVELREKKIKNALRPARTRRQGLDLFYQKKQKKVYRMVKNDPGNKKKNQKTKSIFR